jgi:hypothetical protein
MAAAAAAALVDNEFRAEQVFKQLEDIGAKVFFEKQLTSSDVSASGRVVVPKVRGYKQARLCSLHCCPVPVSSATHQQQLLWLRAPELYNACRCVMTADFLLQAIAEQYLPRIDTPSGTELTVEDAAGDTYTLRFRWAVTDTVT